MRFFPVFLGRRLLFRLYLYQGLLLLCTAFAFFLGRFFVAPPFDAERGGALTFVAESALSVRSDPLLLRQRMDTLRERGFKVSLFDRDGHLLASTIARPDEPPSPRDLGALAGRAWVKLDEHTFAVRETSDAGVEAYAVVGWSASRPIFVTALLAIGILLSAIGFGSIPFARAIAKPLEQLERATLDFGLGDLRARANTNRHDEIGRLAQTFNEMAERVESLRRTEKELLANVSHELLTPLARIRVVLELASDEGIGDRTLRYLADIADDFTELEQVLGDVIATARLDLANERADDPYPPLRRTSVHVGTLVESLGRKLRERCPWRVLHCGLDHSLQIDADRIMVKRAVGNVLENAEKYSPRDSPIEMTITSTSNGEAVTITITDHGHGIAADDLPRVFEPFFRADRSRTRQTGGAGLGLALAKRIVEAHGGSVSIESHLGEGTVVSLSLPVRRAAAVKS